MSKLFESTKLCGMTIKNRFVRSATWEGMMFYLANDSALYTD
jgi:2,4-dienoyl-CoA reductase-like NADH-dependent reductase (Old Yellow Enzyme family)